MGRRNYRASGKRTQKLLRAGRGSGRGLDYEPYIKTQDCPSIGRAHRILGLTSGRIHHVLSDGEATFFRMCDWDPRIVDIREQFPLDHFLTMRIARQRQIRHPVARDGTPLPLTTDFVLTRGDAAHRRDIARTFKYQRDLRSRRTLEKLEIERVYWTSLGVDWAIVTDAQLDRVLAANVMRISPFVSLRGHKEPYPGAFRAAGLRTAARVTEGGPAQLKDICQEVDCHVALPPGTAFVVAKHLIANRILRADLSNALPLEERPASMFALPNPLRLTHELSVH